MKIFAGIFAIPFTVTSMCNITLWILAYKEINRLSADPENHSEHFQSDHHVKKQVKSAFTVGIVVIVLHGYHALYGTSTKPSPGFKSHKRQNTSLCGWESPTVLLTSSYFWP